MLVVVFVCVVVIRLVFIVVWREGTGGSEEKYATVVVVGCRVVVVSIGLCGWLLSSVVGRGGVSHEFWW